ncbi:MAG: thymidine phosphorylase [Alphaproteobacteria bacterium]|nr:thymidine phosphorylase [Alphaproteobacteria bacterium]
MQAVDIIRRKRDGKELSRDDMASFVSGIADWSVTDSQIAAFSVASYLNGLSLREASSLTAEILAKGLQIDWSGMALKAPIADIYTNGGVGDYLQLLVPAVLSACGVYCPSATGHAKEYICGTLDKISAIEGYNPYPKMTHFKNTVYDNGFAIIGTTGEFSPVYRRIRTVCSSSGTAMAEDLLAVCAISQKKSAGTEYIVLDIKCGSGTFTKNPSSAQKLTGTLKHLAEINGIKVSGFISNHNQPTGKSIGSSLEMLEAVKFLLSPSQTLYPRVYELLLAICANALVLSGVSSHTSSAEEKVAKALNSGRAASRFSEMITALGAPPDFMQKPESYLPKAGFIKPLFAPKSGYIKAINGELLGRLWHKLADDPYNLSLKPAVGFSDIADIGTHVTKDSLLALVHADTSARAEEILKELPKAFTISAKRPPFEPLIYETI